MMKKVKMKTLRGAMKRFKKTGSGKYAHKQSHRRHILTKKAQKRKRHLRGNQLVADVDQRAVERMMGDR